MKISKIISKNYLSRELKLKSTNQILEIEDLLREEVGEATRGGV
jgi:hypothetical protein